MPTPAVKDGDGGSPCPEDGEFFNARPDAAEMEEAIGKFVSGLELQEQSGSNELHSLLSKLPVPEANWDRNFACCRIGRCVSSSFKHDLGPAEKVHAFLAVFVQARHGIQV